MKNLIKAALVLTLVMAVAACKKNTKEDEYMLDENMTAPTTVEVTVEETPIIIDVQNAEIALRQVNFAFDQYYLSTEAKQILADNAKLIKTKAAGGIFNVTVEGHTDERGTIAYNIVLGEKRAMEVKKYYTSLGISAARINTVSYGKERPLCYDYTESCHARNRRAETYLTVK